MAKLLIAGEWFDAIASDAYWETEFEQLVVKHAGLLYPSYHVVPFKVDVESEYGIAKADLALIERAYRQWWVVEAELAHHSLHGHVLPQVRKLANGTYDTRHVEHLVKHCPELDKTRVGEMLKGAQPRVAVVVNSPRPGWAGPLASYSAIVGVIEVFRSGRNQHVLSVDGQQPSPPPDALSGCRWDPQIKRFLLVESPATLGPPVDGGYEIEYEGRVTRWTRVESKDRVWLNPLKATSLPSNAAFLLLNEGGRLVLRSR